MDATVALAELDDDATTALLPEVMVEELPAAPLLGPTVEELPMVLLLGTCPEVEALVAPLVLETDLLEDIAPPDVPDDWPVVVEVDEVVTLEVELEGVSVGWVSVPSASSSGAQAEAHANSTRHMFLISSVGRSHASMGDAPSPGTPFAEQPRNLSM